MARAVAASRRSTPNARTRRKMPLQARKPCSGWGPALQEEFAQRGGCRPDAGRFLANAIDGPVGIAAMTGRHVFGDYRVLVVAARSHVSSDPLTLDENLDGACGKAHLDFGAGEAVR